MLPTLSGFLPLQRLQQLVPTYFLLRALLLLTLGALCIATLALHLATLPHADNALTLLATYALVMLAANAYLIVWLPLKEQHHFPARVSHPLLLILLVVLMVLGWALMAQGHVIQADLHLLAFVLILPACSAAGLLWHQAVGVLLCGGLASLPLLLSTVGNGFTALIIISQLVTLILFKSMLEEFRQRTILDLHLAELRATQDLLKQSVTQATRQAVARDLHDELGHLVTRLHLQLQQFPISKDQRPAWEQTTHLVDQLKQQIRSIALTLRQAPTFNLQQTLQLLQQSIPHPVITLALKGMPNHCPAQQGEVMFRICQEAITNCLRHSKASQIHVQIQQQPEEYRIRIQDNGGPQQNCVPGNGLLGLRERVFSLGGSITFDTNQQGFSITATLPDSCHVPIHPAD